MNISLIYWAFGLLNPSLRVAQKLIGLNSDMMKAQFTGSLLLVRALSYKLQLIGPDKNMYPAQSNYLFNKMGHGPDPTHNPSNWGITGPISPPRTL